MQYAPLTTPPPHTTTPPPHTTTPPPHNLLLTANIKEVVRLVKHEDVWLSVHVQIVTKSQHGKHLVQIVTKKYCGKHVQCLCQRHSHFPATAVQRVRQHTPSIKSHTSHVTRHTSHVTRHTSHVTRHTSHVTRHTLPERFDWRVQHVLREAQTHQQADGL
jgi:hypothetical protein